VLANVVKEAAAWRDRLQPFTPCLFWTCKGCATVSIAAKMAGNGYLAGGASI